MPYLVVDVDGNPLQSELLSTETPQSKVNEREKRNIPPIVPPCGGGRKGIFPEEPGSAIHDDRTEDAVQSEAGASAVKRARRHRFMPPSVGEVAVYCEKRYRPSIFHRPLQRCWLEGGP